MTHSMDRYETEVVRGNRLHRFLDGVECHEESPVGTPMPSVLAQAAAETGDLRAVIGIPAP
jgi:hypothetical protein